MSAVRVIGVGSAFGDDRAGLEIAARLAASPPCGCEVVATERPGVDLVDLLAGDGATILLDAVRSGAPAGTLHDRPLDRLPPCGPSMSTHGLGIGDALALARALGHRPRGRFVGIEADPADATVADRMSAAVTATVETAVRRVIAWVERYREKAASG